MAGNEDIYWWQDRNLTTHTERYATDHQASNDAIRATENGWIVVSQSVEESGPPLGPLKGLLDRWFTKRTIVASYARPPAASPAAESPGAPSPPAI
jgi:hypothetical protein